MVKCQDCGREMKTAKSCNRGHIIINGKRYARDTSYYDAGVGKRCHDCGILNKGGNIHHLGCDIERCPRCKGQIISCSCKKSMLQL